MIELEDLVHWYAEYKLKNNCFPFFNIFFSVRTHETSTNQGFRCVISRAKLAINPVFSEIVENKNYFLFPPYLDMK